MSRGPWSPPQGWQFDFYGRHAAGALAQRLNVVGSCRAASQTHLKRPALVADRPLAGQVALAVVPAVVEHLVPADILLDQRHRARCIVPAAEDECTNDIGPSALNLAALKLQLQIVH